VLRAAWQGSEPPRGERHERGPGSMGFLIAILTLLLVAVIVLVVSAPLRDALERRELETDGDISTAETTGTSALRLQREAGRDELEAAREAKYREIRDAEMDFRTGKLSEADYQTLDGELRAEALVILDGLTALEDSEEPTSER
jgi:F0F1-type ATP synthase membrane subunit b/b'